MLELCQGCTEGIIGAAQQLHPLTQDKLWIIHFPTHQCFLMPSPSTGSTAQVCRAGPAWWPWPLPRTHRMGRTEAPFPCSSSGWEYQVRCRRQERAAGTEGTGEEHRQRPGTHSQARSHLGRGAGLREGWGGVRPSPFPACSHRICQDVAALPCAEQNR